MINEHVLVKSQTICEKKFRWELWLTHGLAMSIANCKKLYKRSLFKNVTENDMMNYKNYRNCLNKLKRIVKVSYYQNLCVSLKNNTKKLWEIINHTVGKNVNKSCILEKLKIGNVVYDLPNNIANELASYFTSVGLKYAKAIAPSDVRVTEYLNKIKRNKKITFPCTNNPS